MLVSVVRLAVGSGRSRSRHIGITTLVASIAQDSASVCLLCLESSHLHIRILNERTWRLKCKYCSQSECAKGRGHKREPNSDLGYHIGSKPIDLDESVPIGEQSKVDDSVEVASSLDIEARGSVGQIIRKGAKPTTLTIETEHLRFQVGAASVFPYCVRSVAINSSLGPSVASLRTARFQFCSQRVKRMQIGVTIVPRGPEVCAYCQ